MPREPDWEAIKTVAAVAQHRTVRGAATALRIHHSTVSRRVDALEQSMDSRLFDRQPEGYALTPAGEALVQVAVRFQEQLLATTRSIAGQDNDLKGELTVTMAAPLAEHVIGPELSHFFARYPELEVRLITGNDFLDVSRRQADVAIRIDNNPPDTLLGKRLFSYSQSIYASHEYIAMHDLQAAPETARWLGWDDTNTRHPDWTQNTEFAKAPVWGQFPQLSMQQMAARNGLGIAMLPCMLGDPDPQLRRITATAPMPARSIWILTHNDLLSTARVRAFMKFSETVLRAKRPLIQGELP